MANDRDTIIIGGGAAGLSAALVLGRARRRVLVVDKGEQSNLTAHHVGGLLGHDELAPRDLVAKGREQLAALEAVELVDGEAVDARPAAGGFAVELADGTTHTAGTLVLAMGQAYDPPDIPGVRELWGRDVFHCPFCHGWEVRDRKVAVLGIAEDDPHAALIRGWTSDVTHVDAADVASLRVEDGRLRALVAPDGSELPCEALWVKADMHDRSDIPDRLGLDRSEAGAVSIDGQGRTSLPGVFAAGDLAVAPQQVAIAMGSGHLVGCMVVRDLLLGGTGESAGTGTGAGTDS